MKQKKTIEAEKNVTTITSEPLTKKQKKKKNLKKKEKLLEQKELTVKKQKLSKKEKRRIKREEEERLREKERREEEECKRKMKFVKYFIVVDLEWTCFNPIEKECSEVKCIII